MLRMGRIDTTRLAHEQSVLSTDPAAASENSNICDSITNWCLALVRRPDSAGLLPSPTALGGARKTGEVPADLRKTGPVALFDKKASAVQCF